MRKIAIGLVLSVVPLLAGCGSSMTNYVKREAPWSLIKRVAVTPLTLPSENPAQRELMTGIFAEELRNLGWMEVVEVPLEDVLEPGALSVQELGRKHKVDAVFMGSLDDSQGPAVHLRLLDAATEDLLWSGTFLLGTASDFLSLRTHQQRYKIAFRKLLAQFASEAAVVPTAQ